MREPAAWPVHQDAAGLGEAAGDMPTRGLRGGNIRRRGGLRDLDLEGLAFKEEGHVMSNKRCELPDKSWRAQKKGYEEVHVPAAVHKPAPGEVLVPIKGQGGMPEWTHPAFAGMTSLNRVQSKMKKVALETNENVLLCAPTGAGKTNVAVMCMLNVFAQHRKPDGSGFDLDALMFTWRR